MRGLATLPLRCIQEPLGLCIRIICLCMLVVLVYHVVVNTSQVRIEKDSSEDAYLWQGDYLHKAQAEENVCVYLFCHVYLCHYMFPWFYTKYISFAYGTTIKPICAGSAKHQPTK